MSSPHYASAAARLLRRAPQAVSAGNEVRDRSLATIQRALGARRRRQLTWRAASGIAVAAAAVLVGVGLHAARKPTPQPNVDGAVSMRALGGSGASVVDSTQHRAVLKAGSELSLGSRIETTAGGGAVFRLSTGTELKLDGKSQLALAGSGKVQQFSLHAGGLDAAVAKLGAGARFVVATPDAEVEVRGTRFQVVVLEQAESCMPGLPGSQTRVTVQEGVVEVRWAGQAAQVRAGQHWPEACGEPGRSSGAVESPAEPAPKREAHANAEPAATPARSPAETLDRSPSALAAQTDLFASASRAARRGDVTSALSLYQELVVAYPASALAENAVVERMRLLKSGNPAAARREAESYLARYPGGFGKPEAERILAGP